MRHRRFRSKLNELTRAVQVSCCFFQDGLRFEFLNEGNQNCLPAVIAYDPGISTTSEFDPAACMAALIPALFLCVSRSIDHDFLGNDLLGAAQ